VEENIMNPKAINVEARKKISQAKLDARRVFLKDKGLNEEAIRQDVTMRKIKAELRKSDSQLAAIVAQEEVRRRVEQAKAEKLAAANAPEKEAPEEIPVKKEKKEKKAKKEKAEKQAESEGKKAKPEKKAEQSEA
jgi:hypothetical protein